VHYSVFVMVPFEKKEEAKHVAKLICKMRLKGLNSLKQRPPS